MSQYNKVFLVQCIIVLVSGREGGGGLYTRHQFFARSRGLYLARHSGAYSSEISPDHYDFRVVRALFLDMAGVTRHEIPASLFAVTAFTKIYTATNGSCNGDLRSALVLVREYFPELDPIRTGIVKRSASDYNYLGRIPRGFTRGKGVRPGTCTFVWWQIFLLRR